MHQDPEENVGSSPTICFPAPDVWIERYHIIYALFIHDVSLMQRVIETDCSRSTLTCLSPSSSHTHTHTYFYLLANIL